MKIQRALCGIFGLLFAIGGTFFCWQSPQQISFFSAAAVRAGVMLLVAWLAWPQLIAYKDRVPQVFIVALVAIAAILVLRPRLGRVAVAIAVVSVAVSLLLRWLATLTGPPR